MDLAYGSPVLVQRDPVDRNSADGALLLNPRARARARRGWEPASLPPADSAQRHSGSHPERHGAIRLSHRATRLKRPHLRMELTAAAGSQAHSESELVAGFTIAALIHAYRPKLLRFATSALRDRDAAETVVQDCFLKAYAARAAFRGECSVETWLMRIAVNLIRDEARSRRFRFWSRGASRVAPLDAIQFTLSDPAASAEEVLARDEQVAAIWKATGKLPLRQRLVFLMRFVEDMSVQEIAAATGMREGTIKSHLFRAVKTIRRRLGVDL